MAAMSEKIRIVLVVDEEMRAALRFEAGRRSALRRDGVEVTMSELFEDLVRTGLPDALAEVRKARAAEEKKGRK